MKSLLIGVLLTVALTVSAFALSEGGTVTATALNMRQEPSTASPVTTMAPQGAGVVILEDLGEWYKVFYDGGEGYMHSDYISRTATLEGGLGTGVISASNVNMRTAPNLGGLVLTTHDMGTTMQIVGLESGWFKVNYNGQTGYVRSNLMEITASDSSDTAEGEGTATPSGDLSAGEAIVETAKQYLGVGYVYGGTSPSGFDCSGLVYYVFGQHGYTLSRTAAGQAQNGVAVEKSDLQPGDIVYFTNGGGGSIGHSGIYIGDGQFIHASSGGGRVIITDLESSYYVTYWGGARRIV